MKHFTVYFSVLFFLYFFRWILLNLLPRFRRRYIITLQKCQAHFSFRILIFLFYFRNLISFFPDFPKTVRNLNSLKPRKSLPSCPQIFPSSFVLPFLIFFQCFLIPPCYFILSFQDFAVRFRSSSCLSFASFFMMPYNPFAGPYKALKWLKVLKPYLNSLKPARRLLWTNMSLVTYLFQMKSSQA